ncbi:MAG: hypothetical protein HYR72_14045 [Deltaproteobacteria bacterium]|nr:hypothetical protein [Deltaproteobacteria bacterium]MBI3391466.1 hypothetical protein [Deltaproteobacteria bacterium]
MTTSQALAQLQAEPRVLKALLAQSSVAEPHLRVIPSFKRYGYRWHPIGRHIYAAPERGTFHEFLFFLLSKRFGHEWLKREMGMSPMMRHPVARWNSEIGTRIFEAAGENFRCDASGEPAALLQLSYDLFCLQAADSLPDSFTSRLLAHDTFQSARYEIAAAAVMARAGFRLSWLEPSHRAASCEFLATCRRTGITVAVEARSRRRPGAMAESGTFLFRPSAEAIQNLIRRAVRKRTLTLPFLVFLDLNLPGVPNAVPELKLWWQETAGAVAKFVDKNPAPLSALVLTNYSPHYGKVVASGETGIVGEWGFILPTRPEPPVLPAPLAQAIYESLGRYNQVPAEI